MSNEDLAYVRVYIARLIKEWDAGRDAKVGKMLLALNGDLPSYDARLNAAVNALCHEKGDDVNRDEILGAAAIAARVLWYFWVAGARFIARGTFDHERANDGSAAVEKFVREQLSRSAGKE